jgi:phosphoribosylformylglycinamidine synthase
VQGPGENAGVVDIGDGWCVVFKIESHNHPSFIEPYQGAATGIGGILRDIFTMGARPIATLNSLRFGPLNDPKNRAIMEGVVKGIGDYGNSFGVPTIGGELFFASCYSKNPLVNAFALGLVKKEQIFYGRAGGVGNVVVYVGAKTGRDGIHGATMASAEFDDRSMEKRPQVQVGDPFLEKLLLEACLQALRTGAVIGMQDMGAAGLTCSGCEMGARSGTGIEIDLDLVPQREDGMSAYEIMLSESQERMLLVVQRGYEREIIDIFKKWDLDAVVIGYVSDSHHLVVKKGGQIVVNIPNHLLTEDAPVYDRLVGEQKPDNLDHDEITRFLSKIVEKPGDYSSDFHSLLQSPNLCSKQWIYQQYDHMVRTNSLTMPGADAAVVRVKETRRALAMTLDGNSRYCYLDPRSGARLTVAEAARNLVCVGAEPLAITNCLNFASPEHSEVMWAFSDTIDGIAAACEAFGTPVTGGNVSFYNETDGRGVFPTPVIGMVGLIANPNHTTTHYFKDEGDWVLLLGETYNDLGGSEYLAFIHNQILGPVPVLNMEREKAIQMTCLAGIQTGLLKSAHDCSDGGIAITLAESCFGSDPRSSLGVEIDARFELNGVNERLLPLIFLFSESPSRIIVTVDGLCVEPFLRLATRNGVPVSILGRVSIGQYKLSLNGDCLINESIDKLRSSWGNAMQEYFNNV